ncbi:autotransporter outer membrane beta-barrel domain-containing protein [Variovorax sp. J22P168]|uniref:autotransporter family protein n=1 Tax=Variovorax jilinensis TaxID=3053513 RepID=UPI00257716E5|nr:autotransporter outer membrane beta-barrel domain-containing protein [Variovorax sp. J22P168]MDM0015392.1 autotransporter outer membrane beta-barrel domain-containing protein [Variovorax sp. J22P168]
MLVPTKVFGQALSVDSGPLTVTTPALYNQVTVGTKGVASALTITGAQGNLISTQPTPVMRVGSVGTLNVNGSGRFQGYGLHVEAGGIVNIEGPGNIVVFDGTSFINTGVPGELVVGLTGAGRINIAAQDSPLVVLSLTDQAFSGTVALAGNSNTPGLTHGQIIKVGAADWRIDNATLGRVAPGDGNEGEILVGEGTLTQTVAGAGTRVSALAIGIPINVPGATTAGAATMNVTGGNLEVNTSLNVGTFGGNGTVNQSGGAVRVVAGCGDAARCAAFNIGNQGGTGTYNISGGTLSFTGAGAFIIGRNIGAGTTPSTGILNISGGQVSVAAGNFIVGNPFGGASAQGSGVINQTGGTLTIASDATMYLAGSGNGVYNLNGGTLQVGGTSLQHNFEGQGGTYAFNLAGGTVQVTGTALTTDLNAMLAATTTSAIDTNGLGATWSGVLSGAGALRKNGAGTLTLMAPSTYSGNTLVDAGTLRAGAANTFSGASAHVVASGGTLDLAGFAQTLPALSNAGTVTIGAGSGNTLSVLGPYVGNNGILALGVGAGGIADRLVLNGPAAVASGRTTVQLTTDAGLGAPTTGNGIEVITGLNGANTTSQSAAAAFALAGGHVDGGAYEYYLVPGTTATGITNWYLKTGLPTPEPPIPPNPPLPPIPSGDVVPPVPPGVIPTYRVEVPMLAALPSQMRQASLSMLGNLHQRIGDDDVKGSAGSMASSMERRAWARILSTDFNIRQEGPVAPTSDGRMNGFQAGTDVWANQSWRAGVYVGQLDGDIDVTGFARGVPNLAVGDNDLRSQFLGVYGTYTTLDGWYADAVLQGSRQRYTLEPQLGVHASSKATGWLASLEGGKAFALTGNWFLEPQLQVAYQTLSMDEFRVLTTSIQQDAESSWLVRAGLRVKGQYATPMGILQPYGRVNVYWASSGTDVLRFTNPSSFTQISTPTGNTSTELAGGGTMAVSNRVDVYGEVGKLWASGGDARVKNSIQGSLGLRVRW